MNSERVSLNDMPLEEGEPCLSKEVHLDLSPEYVESLPSRSSYMSEKRADFVGRAILFLLIVAVFVLGVAVAFLVGHWVAKNRIFNGGSRDALEIQQSTVATTARRSFSTPRLTITEAPATATEETDELLRQQRNMTLMDVYPPSALDGAPETFHFTSKSLIKKHRKVPLTPLPRTLLPVHYDLQFDFSIFSISERIPGNASIFIESFGNQTTKEVVFHASSQVHVDRLRLHQNGRPVVIQSVRRDSRTKTVTLLLKDHLKSGWYTLQIEFITTVCGDDDGGVHCYRSTPSGRIARSAPVISFATKFEPSHARTFFPCWDEPHIKATFNVTVLHSRTVTVLSNSAPRRGAGESKGEQLVLTRFHETPPMSTYLLAFAVGPFVPLEMRTEKGIPLTVWTLPEDFLYARFAANFSPIMFDRHEEEFGVAYPFSKLDFVAARSFPVGGMENWGLVIFHNNMILLDSYLEDNANMTVDLLAEQYNIEKIITHEIAHQWFGNLVTMNDWSEIWLNEGFASFYVNDFLKSEHPHLTDSEYYLRLAQLLVKQTSDEKVALVREMRAEAEVEKAFDRFHLYTKGCVVVKMIRDLVSDFDFREGVRRYLKKNAFQAVGRNALWNSMPAYADHGVNKERLEDVIEPWLTNEGMPEIVISRNYNDDSLRVTQRTSDQNRYLIFLSDVKAYDVHNVNASSNVSENVPKRWRRRSEVDLSLRRKRRSDGESTPFDDSLFDNVHSISPLIDDHEPTKSEEIIGELQRRRDRRKKKRLRLRKVLPTAPHMQQQDTVYRHVGVFPTFRTVEPSRAKKLRRSQLIKQLWSIPFSYQFGASSSNAGELTRQFWLRNESMTFVDIELLPSMALLANPNWKYPFRVNYDISNWKMLAKVLHDNYARIPSKSRMQLIVDAEFYLKQSGVPEIYLYMLGYLSKEDDLGVLLIGLDALYRFVDMFRGTAVNGLILIYVREALEQIDTMLDYSRAVSELAAAWLIDPNRLAQLYQLRCAANLSTCEQDTQIEKWLMFAGLSDGDHYLQMTAVCHFLFAEASAKELELVANGVRQFTGRWSANIQLATCVRDEAILKSVVKQIVSTKNAAIYTAVLQNEYTLHYNGKFREILWHEIGSLPIAERRLLFSANSHEISQVARILMHSVRSNAELEQLLRVLPELGGHMQLHVAYLKRKFAWMAETAVPRLQNFLLRKDKDLPL